MDNTKDTEIKVDEERVQKDAERVAREKALENVNKKMVIVDTEEMADAEAHRAADAYMTEDKAKSNIFRKFWKHTFLESFYRQRQVDKVREEILSSGNMYTGRVGADKTAHNNTMQAISERFISDYDGLVREGEKREVLNDTDPKTIQAKNDIKNIITEYAKNHIQEEAFNEEKNRIFNTLNDKKARESLNSYADNLLEIAQNARIALEHGAKMDEMDLDTSIILGKAKSSLKTEAHYNAVDKAVAWTKKSWVGRFISPAAISTTIGLGYSLSVGLGAKVLRSKAAAYGTFGTAVAISTALAGMNESQRLAAERAQHGLERAEGGIMGPESPRREEMEKFQYQMESSKNLAERLRDAMFEKDKNGNDVPRDIKQSDLDKIFASLAEIDARKSLNEQKSIDLISYTNIGAVEKESMDLDMLTARAKIELRNRIQNGKVSLRQGETFDSYLTRQSQAVERCLLGGEKGIDSNDKNFGKFRKKEVIKKMVITAVVGLTVGAVVQEGVAIFKDDIQGFTEGIFHHDVGATTQTPLEHVRSWITGHPTHVPMGDAVETNIFGHDVRFPEGTTWVDNGDGSINIMRGDQVVSDHFTPTWNSDGNLDEAALARLGHDGIVANTVCNTIEGSQEVTSNAEEYIKNHPEGTHHIARDGWYDNDTPKPIFDQNELKLQFGGVNGTGVDSNGNYVFNISHMTSDGSFHNEFSVDAQEKIKNGGLKMIFSLTQGTQNYVFEQSVDINGNVNIDPDSEIAKLMCSVKDGQLEFHGRFGEIVESFGSKDGTEHIKTLATIVGEGNDNIADIIPVPIEVPVTDMLLPVNTEPQMFIPFFTHTPLEPVRYKKENPYYGGSMSMEGWRKDYSPRLKNNGEALLNPEEEIAWYFEDQKRRYPGYVEKELANLEAQNTEPLGKKVEAIACVAAAGHQEHQNIYKTLETYATQKDKKGKSIWKGKDGKYEIFLYVNWPKGQDPQKTFDEIERFKKDHPRVTLRVYKEEIDGKVELGWIKKKIFDLALKKHADLKSKKDIIIITNDADMTFASPNYLENAVGSLNDKKNKKFDAILGRQDLDPEVYKKNPTFHVAMRFWQFMESIMRSKYGVVGTQGRNTIMRGSSYAAVGGNHEKEFWGDLEFGQKFNDARGRSAVAYSNDAWVMVDPRREIDKFKSGEKVAHTWYDFNTRDVRGSSKSDHSVPENLDIVKLAGLEENDPEVVAFKDRLQDEIQEIANSNFFDTVNYTYSPKDGVSSGETNVRKLVERASGLLGMKIELNGDYPNFTLKIVDTKKLRAGLKSYEENDLYKVKMPKL